MTYSFCIFDTFFSKPVNHIIDDNKKAVDAGCIKSMEEKENEMFRN